MVVLLVDDEPFFRSSMKSMLQREGMQVIEAGDGSEAYDILEKNSRVDLMIADLLMPKMDGLKLAESARKLHPDLPILFMTGCGFSLRDRTGDYGFLRKPFHREDLMQAIREIVPNAFVRPESPSDR
jgi:two-component system, cell cycle sensor histidine kinase and response regulator CckA